MTLRTRLVLGVLGTAIPLTLLLAYAQDALERARALERIVDVTTARMADGLRERCEAMPAGFATPGPRRGRFREGLGPQRIYPYDAALRPSTPHAPAMPRELARALEDGDDAAMVTARRHGRTVQLALVRMPWQTGPCAVLLVEHPSPPAPGPERLLVPLVVGGAIALCMWLVFGPVERRLRALTRAVHAGRVRDARDEAEDEIGALGRAFVARELQIEAQMGAILGREEALRAYIANTTHDVLAPVAVLKTQLAEVESLARSGRPVPAALAISALEETHYLSALVHNLNARARLDAGLVRGEEPIDLSRIVERAVSRHAPLAARQGIGLDFAVPEAPVHVLGDITLIEQALSNLVGNAVRYNVSGGHVAVVLETRAARFVLEVLDDGPGVPEDVLARLGERGFRTNEARTRRPDGMGLGLHIAREVAIVHGFSLEFARNEPEGLRVRLEGEVAELVP